jgi:hypothetical protein
MVREIIDGKAPVYLKLHRRRMETLSSVSLSLINRGSDLASINTLLRSFGIEF